MKDAGLSKEILSRNIVSLSSGLKKIIMVVSALISQRKLVIMDEPTEYLDPIMKKNFFNLMQKHKCKGITFFVSTHNLLEIDKYVDYLVVIKNGEIALSKY
jgi:ABC-2 type transport system ATP-binding protein